MAKTCLVKSLLEVNLILFVGGGGRSQARDLQPAPRTSDEFYTIDFSQSLIPNISILGAKS